MSDSTMAVSHFWLIAKHFKTEIVSHIASWRIYTNLGLVVLLSLLCASKKTIAAEGDQELKTIVEKWTKLSKRVKSIYCDVKGTITIPKGRYSGAPGLPPRLANLKSFPEGDISFGKNARWSMNFDNNWLKKEFEEKRFFTNFGKFYKHHELDLFDGEQLKIYLPKRGNTSEDIPSDVIQPELTLQTSQFGAVVFNAYDYPVFFGCGSIPSTSMIPNPKRLRCPVRADSFAFHGKAVLNGCEHVVILSLPQDNDRYRTLDTYWVDISKGCIISRYTYALKGDVMASVDVDYREFSDGWRPNKWTATFYDEDNKLDLVETAEVTTFVVNQSVTKEDCQVFPKPGMIVLNRHRKSGSLYEIDENGLERPIAPNYVHAKGHSIQWYVSFFLTLAVVFVLFFCIKKWLIRRKNNMAD